MKTRSGFVSNSSSSSFCIYGISLWGNKSLRLEFPGNCFNICYRFITKMHAYFGSMEQHVPYSGPRKLHAVLKELSNQQLSYDDMYIKIRQHFNNDDDRISEELYELATSYLCIMGLQVYNQSYDFETYVGRNPCQMDDNETMRQFKDQTILQLREFFDNVTDGTFYTEVIPQ